MRARAVSTAVGVIATFLVVFEAPQASAGGCFTPATHGAGRVVAISNLCFSPALISVDPGTTVTFVNQDPVAHNVNGQGWGHYDNLAPGHRFRATFAKAGIYPFACTLHPGMTGAVIVGDGVGPGNGSSVTVHPPAARVTDPAPALTIASPEIVTGGGNVVPGVAAALIVGVLVGLGLAAIRARTTAGDVTPGSARS
jgi:plastocyanin